MPFLLLCLLLGYQSDTPKRVRDYGIQIGVLPTGTLNAITDVAGVKVGHRTLIEGDSIRTGVTAVLPHSDGLFQEKVPAAIYLGNGFGKLAGYSQVKELGNLETPIILTNTLSVPTAANALISYTLSRPGNEDIRSINPLVGETNDGRLNNIRGRYITEAHVIEAIRNAKSGPVPEGSVGAGTGTLCFYYKGGIGTASRVTPKEMGGYTVGVLVQSNFGGVLQVAGVPVGRLMGGYYLEPKDEKKPDGSCMIVVATDAPLSPRNLERLAKRAMLGLARTGGIASNGSGDYVIAFSTARALRVAYRPETWTHKVALLRNEGMSPLFMAVIEATEEAILNSLFTSKTMVGHKGYTAKGLPLDKVLPILASHGVNLK